MNERPCRFEWDEVKADTNVRRHGITFKLASTVFFDPNLLTVADVEHSEMEDRRFSIGIASDANPAAIDIRLISARRASRAERGQYQEGI